MQESAQTTEGGGSRVGESNALAKVKNNSFELRRLHSFSITHQAMMEPDSPVFISSGHCCPVVLA